jgi:hypothetical protein|nr:MAG TPA: Rho termination factor, N-terminal domain [Caudoviricetes sp.]
MIAATLVQTTYAQNQLEDMTKDELLGIVSDLGVQGVSSRNVKSDIIKAILEA